MQVHVTNIGCLGFSVELQHIYKYFDSIISETDDTMSWIMNQVFFYNVSDQWVCATYVFLTVLSEKEISPFHG